MKLIVRLQQIIGFALAGIAPYRVIVMNCRPMGRLLYPAGGDGVVDSRASWQINGTGLRLLELLVYPVDLHPD